VPDNYPSPLGYRTRRPRSPSWCRDTTCTAAASWIYPRTGADRRDVGCGGLRPMPRRLDLGAHARHTRDASSGTLLAPSAMPSRSRALSSCRGAGLPGACRHGAGASHSGSSHHVPTCRSLGGRMAWLVFRAWWGWGAPGSQQLLVLMMATAGCWARRKLELVAGYAVRRHFARVMPDVRAPCIRQKRAPI